LLTACCGSDVGRTTLWVIREFGLPAIVKACVSCRSARHYPTVKFGVNAHGKLLDVWMLICCERCGRTSKIPVHERIHVQALDSERLPMFGNNDPAMVRDLAMPQGHHRIPGAHPGREATRGLPGWTRSGASSPGRPATWPTTTGPARDTWPRRDS
jgi:hypothetical protein